jgi:hypothetical protein
MFGQNEPQSIDQFNTSAINQQNNGLLGTPQIASSALPKFDPMILNSTAFQSAGNPAIADMVQALKGGT